MCQCAHGVRSPCSLTTLLCHCLGTARIKPVDPVLCLGLTTPDENYYLGVNQRHLILRLSTGSLLHGHQHGKVKDGYFIWTATVMQHERAGNNGVLNKVSGASLPTPRPISQQCPCCCIVKLSLNNKIIINKQWISLWSWIHLQSRKPFWNLLSCRSTHLGNVQSVSMWVGAVVTSLLSSCSLKSRFHGFWIVKLLKNYSRAITF